MERTILDRNTQIKDNLVVITETTEEKFSKDRLEMQLRDLEHRKQMLKEDNSRIVKDYNENNERIKEIKSLIEQLSAEDNGEMEEI